MIYYRESQLTVTPTCLCVCFEWKLCGKAVTRVGVSSRCRYREMQRIPATYGCRIPTPLSAMPWGLSSKDNLGFWYHKTPNIIGKCSKLTCRLNSMLFDILEKAATGLLSIKCNTLIKCRMQFSSLGYNFVAILISFTEKKKKMLCRYMSTHGCVFQFVIGEGRRRAASEAPCPGIL